MFICSMLNFMLFVYVCIKMFILCYYYFYYLFFYERGFICLFIYKLSWGLWGFLGEYIKTIYGKGGNKGMF